jgi:hypothetical protein
MKTLLSLFCFLLAACEGGWVFDIHSLSFSPPDSVYFGEGSDVWVDGMEDSAFAVHYDTAISGIRWRMPTPLYVQVNGASLNAYGLDTIIQIRKANGAVLFSDAEIGAIRKRDVPSRRYLRLGLLARESRLSAGHDLGSLVAYGFGPSPLLILLDDSLLVRTVGGMETGPRLEDSRAFGDGGEIRFSFFRPTESFYLDQDKGSDGRVRLGDTVFTSSQRPMFTPFGAKEFTVSMREGRLRIALDKRYREVISDASIEGALGQNRRLPVGIVQEGHSSTVGNDLIVGNVSNRNEHPLARVSSEGLIEVDDRNDLLDRAGFRFFRQNAGLFWLNVLPLLLTFFVGRRMIKRFSESAFCDPVVPGPIFYEVEKGEHQAWKRHYQILFGVVCLLCLGRVLIGYKLSFTHPFFPGAFPRAVISSVVIPVSVLLVWQIIVRFAVMNGTEGALNIGKVALIYAGFVVVQFLVALNVRPESAWEGFLEILRAEYFTTDARWFLLPIGLLVVASLLRIKKSDESADQGSRRWAGVLNWVRTKSTGMKVMLIFSAAIALALCYSSSRTAYSTPLLVLGACLFFLAGKFWREKPWLVFAIVAIPIAQGIVGLAAFGDHGYLINFFLFLPIILIPHSFGMHSGWTKYRWSLFILLAVVYLLVAGWLYNAPYDPYDRSSSRINALLRFDVLNSHGSRVAEGQSQFFAALARYAVSPGDETREPILSGISGFRDPVVENDLSVPFGLIHPFGAWRLVPISILVLCWCVLLWLTIPGARWGENSPRRHATLYGIVRFYAACMVAGSGLWLLASYYGILPFTGRLIFGLGQDSGAEVAETILLFGMMGLLAPVSYEDLEETRS